MASPGMPGVRPINPHDKAHFSLHISDLIVQQGESPGRGLSSVKYNHKPTQAASARSTTLLPSASSSPDPYTLRIEDSKDDKQINNYSFKGQKTEPKQSYVLLLDPATHTATLEPLESAYTFNLATKNGTDVSATHPHIYPRRNHRRTSSQGTTASDEASDMSSTADGSINREPDAANPFDFRHFLQEDKDKDKDKSGRADENDYRVESSSIPAQAVPMQPVKKSHRLEPDPYWESPTAANPNPKNPQPAGSAPTVRLDRRGSTQATPTPTSTTRLTSSNKKKKKAPAPVPSGPKIKSADFVNSSDDDSDANADVVSSPMHTSSHLNSEDDDDEEHGSPVLTIEIEDPSATSSSRRRTQLNKNALAFYGGSPAAGPISLASATSAANTPEPGYAAQNGGGGGGREINSGGEDVIDFGDLGGGGEEDADGEEDDEDEDMGDAGNRDGDGDVESMDLGPPAQDVQQSNAQAVAGGVGLGICEDENDFLYKSMMEELMEGKSEESEESEAE